MDRQLKSLLNTLIIMYIFLWATKGIVKLLWNTKETIIFEARVKFLCYLIPFFSLIYIIAIYHMVGPYRVDTFYKIFIGFLFLYLFLGIIYNEIYALINKFKK